MKNIGTWLVKILSEKLSRDRPPKRSYLSDFDRICYEIRPADVLLVEGRNAVSRVIQKLTLSPWSHAAIYIGRIYDIPDAKLREQIHQNYSGPTSDQLIIESLIGQGTIISPIKKYHEDHLRICRPAGLSVIDAQKVIAYAISRIGRSYNVRQFLDLGRFLLGSHFIPRRWKSSLFNIEVGQATHDICSSMIAAAFSSIKFPILPLIQEDDKHRLKLIQRNTKLFTPSDFDYSPYFNIIKYPIFTLTHVSPYANLPWHEGLVYSDELGVMKTPEKKDNEDNEEK